MIKKWFTLILAINMQTLVIAQNNYIENNFMLFKTTKR